MTTIVVPPLSPFAFNINIGTAGMPHLLDNKLPLKFRGLRGIFKITVTRYTDDPPYYFSFVMKGGTGRYRTDPGRPFFYLMGSAVDNNSKYLKVEFLRNTTYNNVKIKTEEGSASITYLFTFPVSISQWTFPTIQRTDGLNPIIGVVSIKVENYAINSI